jgi:hypothetical protein
MSTTTTTTETRRIVPLSVEGSRYPEPLTLSGALDQFKYEESTPVIGREYSDVNLVDDIINAKNADELIRDLAITSKSSELTPQLHY